MKFLGAAVLGVAALPTAAAELANAADATCAAARSQLPGVTEGDMADCVCDKRLRNLQTPVRAPFRVVAACDLRWDDTRAPIDLSTTKLDLRRAPTAAVRIVNGTLFVSGRGQLVGELLATSSPAATHFFRLKTLLVPTAPGALPSNFDDIRFVNPELLARFELPPKLREADCFRSDAKIAVAGFRVVLGYGTDAEGSFPLEYRVVDARKFGACE